MVNNSQEIWERMFAFSAWNHKLRLVLSASMLSLFGSLLGMYLDYSYSIDFVSKTSIVVLATMMTVFVGLTLLAFLD